ncbi:hypothetical protein K501DRAFT_263521 [Backusella circina FSU 941]|nr:hypothetical protein K501DRAFT_263521 [Backusella circina FSU 941]
MVGTDDIWGSSDDEREYERDLAEREWERLQEDHGNTGYKEGIVEGKEINMQRGFDRGYIEGLAIGKEIGNLKGVVSTYMTFYAQILKNQQAANALASVFEQLDKIEVHHIYSVDYFRENGPKDTKKYVAPQDFVANLRDKVRSVLNSVNEEHADRS